MAVHEGEQEVLACSHRHHARRSRRPAGARQGFGHRAFHLHSLLTFSWQAFSASPPSITTPLPASSSTARSSPPRRKNASHASSTIIIFQYTRRAIVFLKQT